MATTQLMIQFETEATVFAPFTTLGEQFAWASINLDPHKTTVVREIASEEIGGLLGVNMPGAVNLTLTSRVMVDVELTAPKGGGPFLVGPSCVSSPPFSGIAQIRLTMFRAGITAPPGGELEMALMGGGAHLYVDQIS